jgi:hypothetical protein
MVTEFCGVYSLKCDVCGNESWDRFDSFNNAIKWKEDKANLWTSHKNQGSWEDVCPECNGNSEKEDSCNCFNLTS